MPNSYQMWAGNLLKRSAERARGFRYALVLRLRPDLLLLAPLPAAVLRPCSGTLWHADYEIDPGFQVSDKLSVASSEVMDYYTSVWPRLRAYWKRPLGSDPPFTIRI